ncbi:hypothetical protein LIA77_11347 [Sarocladium implicatum]|nr:hypothetical protein LIA77_11347 [Sarocladium implicatum]
MHRSHARLSATACVVSRMNLHRECASALTASHCLHSCRAATPSNWHKVALEDGGHGIAGCCRSGDHPQSPESPQLAHCVWAKVHKQEKLIIAVGRESRCMQKCGKPNECLMVRSSRDI